MEGFFGVIGLLAAIVTIITQVLKNTFKKLPTKILAFIISMVVTITFCFVAPIANVWWLSLLYGIGGGFVVSFVSTYGWESFDEIVKRFKFPE